MNFKSIIGTVCIALSAISFNAQAIIMTGSFNIGSGSTNIIANGDFESGLSNWTQQSFGKGIFNPGTVAFAGTGSAQSQPFSNFSGPGFALQSSNIAVTSGASYVLSGFVNTANMLTGRNYIDLSDITNDPNLGIGELVNGVSDWQFIYETFTATSNNLKVRLVHDLNVTAGEYAIFDNISITLASEFVAPTLLTVPEPSIVALLVSGLIAIGLVRRKNRT